MGGRRARVLTVDGDGESLGALTDGVDCDAKVVKGVRGMHLKERQREGVAMTTQLASVVLFQLLDLVAVAEPQDVCSHRHTHANRQIESHRRTERQYDWRAGRMDV